MLNRGKNILNRWAEYCSKLYIHRNTGDRKVLNIPQQRDCKRRVTARRDKVSDLVIKIREVSRNNVPAETIVSAEEPKVDMLHQICNKIRQVGEWAKPWTRSLVSILPKEGNLKYCHNYRTISLNSHPNKVMLKVI
ncbi:endonuclease-reverse transcriptase [Plakobranchus ocellatus]|uniref:Endonuclease-reverse transcriptase n=1 Tax=Plakobranchus ocellatus TaxID=259542 RepID=A0AAV3ZYK4_9GAST|nr:endonuclease-reverse transcriptase [Plakobranchus ocellatus]